MSNINGLGSWSKYAMKTLNRSAVMIAAFFALAESAYGTSHPTSWTATRQATPQWERLLS